MITFTSISLESKDIFNHYLAQDNLVLSDMSFANCFIWRNAREITFAQVQDTLVIQTRYEGKNPYIFYPIGGGDKQAVIELCKKFYQQNNLPLEIHALNTLQAEQIKTHYNIQPNQNRDRFDYVYNVPELITLSGRKYHKKKNHLNFFLQEHPNFVFEEISASNAKEIMQVNNKWFEANPNKTQGLAFENLGINDALKFYDELGLKGGVIRINGEIEAFSFGEVLAGKLEDKQVALMHIEKANPQIRGIYQAINQQVLEHCFAECGFVNREEDLGIEGLRKAKLSYQPYTLLEKFEVVL